jgi:nitrate/TMAO reductase-like tetraheme cytochrome c subunit
MRLAIALVAVAGCATPPPLVTALDAERANVAIEDLQQGRTLLLAKCGNCHTTPVPAEVTAAAWPKKVDEMAGRAGLTPSQHRLIELYLVVKASP